MVEFHPRFHAAPPHRPSVPWRASSLRASALGSDPRALGRDFFGRRADQVPHHLPADRRVGIKQPLYDGRLHPQLAPLR